jgi:SanA protein
MRRAVWAIVATPPLVALFFWATNSAVLASAEGRVYTSPGLVPSRPVALVLGTSPVFKGSKNPFFEGRMDAAAELYRSKKVAKLLVSGDNGTRYYDEPTAMKEALISRGVPQADIVLDYAGFHTLDSVVRAHRVFGVDRCVIVTDDFHLPRALYIAHNEGIDAVGYQTAPVPRALASRVHVREVSSRTLAWIELNVTHRQPKFLGSKISL